MKEATGDLWQAKPQFIRCITTNGVVKKNGELVMGRGNALQAKERYPQLPGLLGSYIKSSGNILYYIEELNIASFPVKYHWRDKADLKLIAQSCYLLNVLLDNLDKSAVLPRPGCANGRLDWEREVKPLLSQIISDRVWIITL